MPRVRQNPTKNQPRAGSNASLALPQQMMPLDDGTLTTPVTLAMIQALIPLGLRAVEEALLAEVEALAGPRYARDDERPAVVRWGAQRGSIYLADQKLPITVPRVRHGRARCEVPLATYAALQTPRAQDVGLFRRVLGGLSCREYEAAAEAVPEAFGLARSSVSRCFIRASARELRRLQERWLDDAEWLVLVLDGAKGLRAAVRDVFCAGAQVQRCQWHKREKVVSYLAKQDQPIWRRKLQAAWAHPAYADAKRALDRLSRELRLLNESAAASLAEGLDETLTLHRLGVFPELGVSFKTTNLIESVMARPEAKTQRVTRWRTSDQKLRWCAAALWATERQFRRVKNHRQLPLLKQALQNTLSLTTLAAA